MPCSGKETKIPCDFLLKQVSKAVIFNPKYLENQKCERTQYKYFNSSLRCLMNNLWGKKILIQPYNPIPAQRLWDHTKLPFTTSYVYMRIYCWLFSIIAITNVLALIYTQRLHCSHIVRARAVISLRRQRKSPGYTSFMIFFLLFLDKSLQDRQLHSAGLVFFFSLHDSH